jgi:phage terminase large subunit
MRARYLYGDWDSVEGGYFEDDYNPGVHVIAPFKIPRDWPKFRVMDWGFKTHGVCGWFALDPDENLYLFYEFNFRLMKDAEVAKRITEIEKSFGFWDKNENKSRLLSSVADTQLWEERGDSGKSKAQVFADHGIYWEPADKASIQRNAERVTERLRDYDERRPPALLIFDNCKKTTEMFSSIKVDEKDSLIPDKTSGLKHWFDIVAYGAARASRGRGSIVMELHEFDRPDNDNSDEALPKASGFGYGS